MQFSMSSRPPSRDPIRRGLAFKCGGRDLLLQQTTGIVGPGSGAGTTV